MTPRFSDFKPIELSDRDAIHEMLWAYQPEISKLCFANLFNWRHHYRVQWCVNDGILYLIAQTKDSEYYGFEPVSAESRVDAVRNLLDWLGDEKQSANPRIERADRRLVDELSTVDEFNVEPQLEHHDYVYLREDLVKLSGRRYHTKKNHLNAFLKNYQFEYQPLTPQHIPACKEMAGAWCTLRRCEEDMSLSEEYEAVNSALDNYTDLKLSGGVILIRGKVEAFSIGEKLNSDTAVVHIEKANPEIRGLYTAINQQCCKYAWGEVTYINREQDLGEEGIRKAKLSYHPHHMAENFIIRLAE